MKIPDQVRKAVGFVAYENRTNGDFIPVGSFFFLGHDAKPGETNSPKMYAVTARHVIDGLRAKGAREVMLRLNPKRHDASLITHRVPLDDWFFHPTDNSIDVAIKEMGIPVEADHLVVPLSLAATKQIFDRHDVELGDEVFISGLFRHHYGYKRNIPIVRIGNLAALKDERVSTKSFGEIEAYLIEARSTGGLSGSPVFLNLGSVRQIEGEVKFAASKGPIVFLLGLIHGHFLVEPNVPGVATEATNAGIAIVVPVESIILVITEYERDPEDTD